MLILKNNMGGQQSLLTFNSLLMEKVWEEKLIRSPKVRVDEAVETTALLRGPLATMVWKANQLAPRDHTFLRRQQLPLPDNYPLAMSHSL